MFSRIVTVVAFAIAVLTSAGRAETQLPTQKQFTVTARIVAGCGVVGSNQTSGVHFGTLDFGVHPATATGPVNATAQSNGSVVQIQCSPGTSLGVTVDGGLHPGAGGQRNLQVMSGSALIPYQLYSDAAHAQPIPVGQTVYQTVSGTVSLPVYGALTLPGAGTAPSGTYTDTVQVTLSY
ncbi:Csu type fimbrial protein [Cupriavidus sp. H39]|uniref:Csu type fimbrial protein n=1 Tax=Cupriavidus sp. H39 TaxID=3401635 RepID=UPI003D03F7F6